MGGQIHMHRKPATPKDIHVPEHVVSPPPRYQLAQDHNGLAVTVEYSHSTICWQENVTVLASPSQSRCWQSAEPGGDLKEATFLPRNPEKYRNLTPTFLFPKDGPSPDQEQLSHHANSSDCRMSWARVAGYPALKGTVSFPFLLLLQCWMQVWS